MSELQPVSIQELSGLAEGRRWSVHQRLDGLPSLTPVCGHVHAVHRGNVLEVDGEADTIVTLCCDRCLQHFNHPLHVQARELIWLGDAAREQGLESDLVEHDATVLELDPDALSESLDPHGSFDPAHWTFEQLSLQLPLVSRCGADCPGPASWGNGDEAPDPRWAALRRLQQP